MINWNPQRITRVEYTDGALFDLPPEELISASLTYGSLGTCQGGTLRTAAPWPDTGHYTLHLDGQNVYAGIAQPGGNRPGELRDITLLAPHRIDMEIPGANPTVTTYGVPFVGPLPHERLIDVITRQLDPHPTSEYGQRPDGTRVLGRPESAPYLTLDAGQAVSVADLGPQDTGYVTHAVFDPGDGWDKTVYSRFELLPVPARTDAATADPAILTATQTLAPAPRPGVTQSAYFDGVERNLTQGFAVVQVALPAPTGTRKSTGVVWPVRFAATSIPAGHTVTVYLTCALETSTDPAIQRVVIRPADASLELRAEFALNAEQTRPGGTLILDAWVTCRRDSDGTISTEPAGVVLQPTAATLTYETPNTAGVIMPDGWTAPLTQGRTYELTVPGWHVPPLRITGLPGGAQMAAGTTVTWTADECRTTITTQAWPFAGQRRGAGA